MENNDVVDLEMIKTNFGDNEVLIQEMLIVFLRTLPDEVRQLQISFEKKDWQTLRAIVHRLKGGGSYCGTLRLNHVCTRLEEVILANEKKMISSLYQQLMAEIEKVKEVIQQLNAHFCKAAV